MHTSETPPKLELVKDEPQSPPESVRQEPLAWVHRYVQKIDRMLSDRQIQSKETSPLPNTEQMLEPHWHRLRGAIWKFQQFLQAEEAIGSPAWLEAGYNISLLLSYARLAAPEGFRMLPVPPDLFHVLEQVREKIAYNSSGLTGEMQGYYLTLAQNLKIIWPDKVQRFGDETLVQRRLKVRLHEARLQQQWGLAGAYATTAHILYPDQEDKWGINSPVNAGLRRNMEAVDGFFSPDKQELFRLERYRRLLFPDAKPYPISGRVWRGAEHQTAKNLHSPDMGLFCDGLLLAADMHIAGAKQVRVSAAGITIVS